jgi:pimeloyl-ACP methyl ester carboxylesterase
MSLDVPPPAREPLVVLVHGAWHGAWCWATLQSRLDDRGIASIAIDLPGHGASTLPLGDLHGDAAHVVQVIDRVIAQYDRDIVLVGHSYGGAVITQAALDASRVRHLVYLTAFALETGESVVSLLASLPQIEVALTSGKLRRDNDTSLVNPSIAQQAFYGCCADGVVTAAMQRLGPQPLAAMVQPVTGSPRPGIASTYVCCELDGAIALEHQHHMAQRCDHVTSLRTDHSPFASMPDATADIIEAVVRP